MQHANDEVQPNFNSTMHTVY